MEEGLPGEEPALAQEARAEEESGSPVDRAEPPRPRNPRPAAEPRPQQVGRQKKEAAVCSLMTRCFDLVYKWYTNRVY